MNEDLHLLKAGDDHWKRKLDDWTQHHNNEHAQLTAEVHQQVGAIREQVNRQESNEK